MVFSDPVFILGFLPICLLVFHLLRKTAGGDAAVLSLIGFSMVFYAYWSVPFLLLLFAQIVVNFFLGRKLEENADSNILKFAVVFNLALLGYFKYRNFFLENVGEVFGWQFTLTKLIVPLGISFHTFQQIAILMDVRDGEAKIPPFLNYVLFVLFFPQLIAGPVVLHREMGKQVSELRAGHGPGFSLFGAGVFLFLFGLFKKVALADNISAYADAAFVPDQILMMPEAWIGSLAYALQLFFDFSGYSDMAVGLGLMFGFKLPNNFLVPFAAPSMIEYWKRWHITMTRFFTMYVYTPLALSATRYSMSRNVGAGGEFALAILLPTMATFLLSGLWHGAGWTFICFGLVNGIGLAINHAWNAAGIGKLPRLCAWLLTMITVLISLIYFRSNTVAQADYIIRQMFMPAQSVLSVPAWASSMLPFLKLPIGTFSLFSELKDSVYLLGWTGLLACLSVLLPPFSAKPEALKPTQGMAIAMAGMAWLVIGFIDQPRSFLYFAF